MLLIDQIVAPNISLKQFWDLTNTYLKQVGGHFYPLQPAIPDTIRNFMAGTYNSFKQHLFLHKLLKT